jgi:hypothetical protein
VTFGIDKFEEAGAPKQKVSKRPGANEDDDDQMVDDY